MQPNYHQAIAAKTVTPHQSLPGTILTAAAEVEAAGGQALAIECDIRSEEDVQAAVDQTVQRFGGIDIVVNNASAIALTDTESTEMKRYAYATSAEHTSVTNN